MNNVRNIPAKKVCQLVLVNAVLVLVIAGCNGITQGEMESIVSEVNKEEGYSGEFLRSKSGDGLRSFKVFVDRTLSMKPFVGEEESSYDRMIRILDNVFATRSSFYGFGYRTQEGDQYADPISAVQLQDPSTYQWVNNDYADIFSSFNSVEDTTRLVISDGVQSDVGGGERFRRIVKSIGNWIDRGGVFAVLAYRAPYRGTYYHEVPEPGQIEYECSDRPFYVFGFLPSVDAFGDLSSVLADEGFTPVHQVLIGEAAAKVSPRQRSLPERQRERGSRLLNGFKDYGGEGDLSNVYYGRPILHGGNANVRVDASVNLQGFPWKGLSDQELERVLGTAEPSVRSWSVNSVLADTASTHSLGTIRIGSSEAEARILSSSDSSWMAGVQIPLSQRPRKDGRQLMASVLSLNPSPTGATRLIPSDLSTRRDNRASACNSTLNLRPMLGSVLRQHYVIGRTMLVTDWR